MRVWVMAATAAALVVPAAADAQRGGAWQVIGYKSVGAGADRDTIKVRGTARYRQVRLCSLNRPIRMLDFQVEFANGNRQNFQVRKRIPANGCTRALDLRGERRDIARVMLTYARLQPGTVPLVRVMAR